MALDGRARRRRVQRFPFVLSNFFGLHDDSNNAALESRDLRRANNVMLYRARLIGGRFGYHRDPFAATLKDSGAADAAITYMTHFRTRRDTVQRVIFVAEDRIYEENAAADPSTATNITGPALTVTGGSEQDDVWTGASFKDQLFIANAVNTPRVIGAAGVAAVVTNWYSDNRTPRYVHSQFGHLFFAGYATGAAPTDTLNPMTVNHGELYADDLWLENNVVDKIGGLSIYGDEYVTGMFRHRDFLMIGTNRRIYPVLFTGEPAVSLWRVQRPLEVGLADQRAVASINGEFTFFMDPRGDVHTIREVASGFGEIGVQALSFKIKNYVRNLNPARIKYTNAEYYAERGWVVFAVSQGVNQGSHNELLVLDINEFPLDDPDHRAAKWFRFTNVPANVLAVMGRDTASADQVNDPPVNTTEPQVDGLEFLYFGTATGWSKRFTPTISYDEADDGTQDAIVTQMATKFFDFEEPDSQKSIVECYFDMEPGSADTPGPNARVIYDYGVRQSNEQGIDMSGNVAEGFLLGTSELDVDIIGSLENVTQDRIKFAEAGNVASIELNGVLQGTQQWRMQTMRPIVELRGIAPQFP